MVNSPRGRRPGTSSTREELLSAAREQFLLHGYAATSARKIAEIAGVDHAMVNYHFGSKRALFAESMSIRTSPRVILDAVLANGGISDGRIVEPRRVARNIAATFLRVWDEESFREPLLAVIREATGDDAIRVAMAEYISTELLARLAEIIGGEDASNRAASMAAQLVGTIMTRYVFRLEPIASIPREQLADAMAAMLVVPLQRRVPGAR